MPSLARTILEEHLERGELVPGHEIALRVDQALAQDATGTMAMMQFELFGEERVRVDTAVVYVDHNILQIDFKNPDDHRFLQAMAARYGAWLSRSAWPAIPSSCRAPSSSASSSRTSSLVPGFRPRT